MGVTAIRFVPGRLVDWPPAPGGLAAVERATRRRARLAYVAGSGRVCRPWVRLGRLRAAQRPDAVPLPVEVDVAGVIGAPADVGRRGTDGR